MNEELLAHLAESRLAGAVQTTDTMTKVRRLLRGDPTCTFGLSDWERATEADVVRAIKATAGAEPAAEDAPFGYIDPAYTIAGIERHARLLAPFLAGGGHHILLATGHPTGLLQHYLELARELEAVGNQTLVAHDDGPTITAANNTDRARTVRFVASVACVYDGLALVHSHLSAYMETMLDELERAGTQVDLVIGDHGMAGAAVERGIPTLSIADVNDPALPLAHLNGRHDGVLVIDDNIAPRLFRPVTRQILHLAWEANV
jgi:hypothetical protein